ncbi:hypothetical protein Hypma_016129 [Hypsizygus marmoreus]|uniref:Uncharacterized protein n=1 Tax=Hypsizygus marmoreus TaxID=39966 RepID=A0A369K6Y4_HYPMA|nr:hypothetical protein Hypma_016129 [Hypsizygus marmoreus]
MLQSAGEVSRSENQTTDVHQLISQKCKRQLISILEFQDELSRIEEQGKEIAPYVKAFEAFLNPSATKIPETDFSLLNRTNLTTMGIKFGTLQIKEQELDSLVSISRQTHHPHIERLCARIQLIYHHVDMQSGARMITESILWTVAEIAAGDSKLPLCMFPDMPIGSGEGVLIKNAVTGGETWLTGKTDYGICTYDEKRVDRSAYWSCHYESV